MYLPCTSFREDLSMSANFVAAAIYVSIIQRMYYIDGLAHIDLSYRGLVNVCQWCNGRVPA